MKTLQPGVLAPVPPAARYLNFSLKPRANPREARSLDAFEAQLRRMVGAEDGIADAPYRFTRPVSGSYFWCPPVRRGRIDLGSIVKSG